MQMEPTPHVSANDPNRTFDYSAAMGPGAFARDVILRRTMSM